METRVEAQIKIQKSVVPIPAAPPGITQQRLLYSRGEAMALLGCSQSTLIRMEHMGRLRAVKITGLTLGKTFYRAADVARLSGTGKQEGQDAS